MSDMNQRLGRQDESPDELFYAFPRKVVHIDDHAISTLKAQLASLLPPGGVCLDLMSSWRSHLPDSLRLKRVVGLGMNAEEMADNPQLDTSIVHNLNLQPELPFEDAVFDAAICTVSVQYLTQPVDVFQSVWRVLKPAGRFVVSFSNRCFPTKAVWPWVTRTDAGHLALVTQYFEASGRWDGITAWRDVAPRGDHDPLYLVDATKSVANSDR